MRLMSSSVKLKKKKLVSFGSFQSYIFPSLNNDLRSVYDCKYFINAVNSIFYDATGKIPRSISWSAFTQRIYLVISLRIKEIISQKIIFGKTLKF